MNTITDDQIAEIELDFQSARKLGREAYIDMQDGEALITRLREAEREAIKTLQLLAPAIAYIDGLDISRPGQSIIKTLIEDHKRLREAERDAARYLWILNHYAELHGDRTLAAMALSSGGLDAAIDAAMLSAREAAE